MLFRSISYQIRTNEIESVVFDKINEDTNIYDSIKNYYIGKVTKKELATATREVYSEKTGEVEIAEVPNKVNVILTIECDGVVNGKDIVLGGGYDLKVGNQAFVKGKGYAAIGYVISINRLDETTNNE